MLIFWCWLFIDIIIILNNLVPHFAYSSDTASSSSPLLTSKAACIFHEQELLTFTEQPFSACLPASGRYQARCSASRLKTSGSISVKWHVIPATSDQPPPSFKVDGNGSLAVTCENRRRSCNFKVWCELVDTNTDSEVVKSSHFSRQAPSIRSRIAIVNIGGNGCLDYDATSIFTIQQPEPRARIVKAHQMANVTLPCLTFIPEKFLHSNYYFSTNWYRNGRRLFDPSSASSFFEADGNFNIERKRRDDFFLWSNLTIYHVQAHHQGYYQCFIGDEDSPQNFNVIYLEIASTTDQQQQQIDFNISLSMPAITDVTYSSKSRDIRVLFRKSEIYLRKGELTANLSSRASSFASLNYTIGVVRQQKSTTPKTNSSSSTSDFSSPPYMDCLAGLPGGSAETSFSDAQWGSDGIADFELPRHFFADLAACRDFYAYAIFVKYFSYSLNMTSMSPLYELNYDNFDKKTDHFSLAVDEARSGVHFACLDSKYSAARSTNRMVPATPLKQRELVWLEPFCTCDFRSGESSSMSSLTHNLITSSSTTTAPSDNTTSLSSSNCISVPQVPFLTNGLIPNTSYCISTDYDCVTYFVPGSLVSGTSSQLVKHQVQPLSFERLPNDKAIAVSWSLAHCSRQLSKLYEWSIQLNYRGNRSSIPTTDCSGRVLFLDVPHFTSRRDASVTFDDETDLSVLAIPAIMTIENLSAFVVTRSRVILTWTAAGFVDDPEENRQVTEVGYSIYACLPSTPMPSNGVMDKKLLECLGCRYICRVSAYSLTTNDVMHAELAGYDEHIVDFQFVIWADVSLLVDPGRDYENIQDYDSVQVHEMVPAGIVGQINVSLAESQINGHRPQQVSLSADNSNASQIPHWNVTWLPPPSPSEALTLISYSVHIVPISHHLYEFSGHEDDTYYNVLIRIVEFDQLSLFIENTTNELLAESAEKCPRLWPEAYVVQIVPIWAWENRHKRGNTSFIVDGAPSAPFIYRSKFDRTVEDDTERLSRLKERALSYEEMIKTLENHAPDAYNSNSNSEVVHMPSSRYTNNNNEVGGGGGLDPSSLLAVPIVIACVAFLCILLIAMFFVYRCQVRHHAAKYRPGSGDSSEQETRTFVSNNSTSMMMMTINPRLIIETQPNNNRQNGNSPPLLLSSVET